MLSRWLRPSLGDFLILALMLWLVAMTILSADAGLLLDAATGCHIRTGQYMLENGTVPYVDPFSFTKSGQPWFAWEWLSDLLFAAIVQTLGMQGLVVLSALLIAVTGYGVVRYCLWAGGDALSSLILFQLWVGASSLHFLARPHVFTLLFMLASLWLIDLDRRSNTRLLWLLVPLTIVWVNLHGGFVALVVSLVVIAAGTALEALFRSEGMKGAKRYLAVAAGCLLASGINPYGFEEHRHLASYLSAQWIREMVEEFQSPSFQKGGIIYYEILLVGGVLLATRLIARREFASALLVLAWAHASLTSVRHIPIFATVCAPLLARELVILRERWIASDQWTSFALVFRSLGSDHAPGLLRTSAWAVIPALLLLAFPFATGRFVLSEAKFPSALITQQGELISGSRVFTLDSWADYLTYRYYPKQRIFVDGRSDFFGEELSLEYLQVLNAQHGWDDVLRRYRVNLVLVPQQSSLASVLRLRPDWTLVEQSGGASLFRTGSASPETAALHGANPAPLLP